MKRAMSSEPALSQEFEILDKATTRDGSIVPVRKGVLFNPDADPGLAAYQISLLPNAIVAPHFHVLDQFQVFVDGSGRIGHEAFRPITVHYSDRYSPYGPIVCGPEGVKFMVFRLRKDLGAFCMPESRAQLTQRPGRNITLRVTPQDDRATDALLQQDDGLAVLRLSAGPDEKLIGPQSSGGGGQYLLVTKGALRMNDALLPAKSCLFISPDEVPLEASAGKDGCEALLLQYPRNSWTQRELHSMM